MRQCLELEVVSKAPKRSLDKKSWIIIWVSLSSLYIIEVKESPDYERYMLYISLNRFGSSKNHNMTKMSNVSERITIDLELLHQFILKDASPFLEKITQVQ